MIFVQNLINDSCRQIEKTQGQIVGTKMGSFVGNDQDTPLYGFMRKIGIKCEKIRDGFKCKKIGGNNSKMCVCSTVKNVK